ncbi:pentatricopeptide repeat-containing protein 2, mitochondrial [Dendroctonus ponderosae]
MAQSFLTIFRKPLNAGFLSKLNNVALSPIYCQDVKHLYSKTALGLDGFVQQKERIKMQMASISDKFKDKMSEYVASESKNLIFTEDLKNMVHLADTDKEIELAIQMTKRYNQQNRSLRFGNYIFGPVIMRMFYVHNKPDLAVECFKSEELRGIFEQTISYQLLLDLLYENQKYQEILDLFEIITDKQVEGLKYPRHAVVLAMAACYKLNNPESLEYALKQWKSLSEFGHQAMRKATTFCAGLALNQGKPEIALELLTSVKNQNYTTVRNLKVASLAGVGRVEDAIPILKAVLSEDVSLTDYRKAHTFNRDVIERVKQAMASSDDAELTLEFNRLEQIFEKEGHISDQSLDDQLCSEIQKTIQNRDREFRDNSDFQPRGQYNYNRGYQQRQNQGRYNSSRPGLVDLV